MSCLKSVETQTIGFLYFINQVFFPLSLHTKQKNKIEEQNYMFKKKEGKTE